MNRCCLLLIMLICLLRSSAWAGNEMLSDALDLSENVIELSFSELGSTISGVCFGGAYTCVYSHESYVLLDKQGTIVYQHTLKHPQIKKKDGAYIEEAIYCGDTLWLLVLDHSVGQSYLLSQEQTNRPEYGRLLHKEIASFDMMDNQILLAGLDEKSRPWYGCMTVNGELLWEKQFNTKEYIPKLCAFYNGKAYIVSKGTQGTFRLAQHSAEGNLLTEKEFSFSELTVGTGTPEFIFFHKDVTERGISLFGSLQFLYKSQGLFLCVDENLDITQYQVYDQYSRIQTGITIDNQNLMLAFADDPSASTSSVISADESVLFPLETKESKTHTFGMVKDPYDRLYVFGFLYGDQPTKPSSFIAEIIP